MRRRGLGVVSTVLGLSLLFACGGDDTPKADLTGADPEDRSSSATGDGGVDGTDETADVAAVDPAAIRSELEELLVAYDRVRNQIVVDPGVAADRGDPLIEEYVALFEPDSPFAEQVLNAWAANGEAGSSLQPYSPDLPALELRLDGDIEGVADEADEIEFPWCETHRYRVFESDRELEQVELAFQGGTGVAVRIDGQWRLRQMDAIAQLISCRSQGGSG